MGNEQPSRRRRATTLIALALIVIFAASLAYLRPTHVSIPQQKSSSINRSLATTDSVAYDFMSPSMGWALDFLGGPSSTTGQFMVFRTTDGAKHWLKQLTGQSHFCGFSPLPVQFLDQMHGFIAVRCPTEQLYRTADAGAHWEVLGLPSPQIETIAFSDPNNGLLLAQPITPAAVARDLYASRDAGQTWQRLPDPPADAYSLIFRHGGEAWLSGFGAGIPHVYSSRDAGRSWQRHDLPPPPGGPWETGSHLSPSVAFLPAFGVIVSISPVSNGGILRLTSFDSSDTWMYVPTPPGDLSYQDAFHWWATSAGALYKSSDAGQTWAKVADKLPDLQLVPYVLDSNHAWAEVSVTGGYGLAFTNDGGIHWTRATVPEPT